MTETNKMLEECANYLLNHCFVLGGVEDQRAKYLYVQDHLSEVRAVFAPLGYAVVLYPAPLQAAALVNEHEGSQARLLKYESILLLVLRLLYLQKRESLSASADQVLVTVEEVQAELQKMNLPRRLDQPTLERLLRTLRRYNLARPVGRLSGLDSRIEVFPTVLLALPDADLADAAAEAGRKAKGGKPQKGGRPADARSARRENSRACREAAQGRSVRSRDGGAGEATPAQSLAAWREFAEEYFPELAGRPAVVHGGGVLLPAAFPQTNLHVLRAGVFVGSVQKGRFVPEHHLFTAFGALCKNREELTLADPRTVEYLSGREAEARTAADGWCCVTVDGWPLGGGKVSGGRVKNHYPKALRLL